MKSYYNKTTLIIFYTHFILNTYPNMHKFSITGKEYMVATDHPEASKAGAQMLAEGGNAIDAAVASCFALGVVRPHSGGIGGGGFMLYAAKNKEPLAIDFRATAPKNINTHDYIDKENNIIPEKTMHGPWSVAIPGAIHGLLHILKKYGTKNLNDILQPAIKLAQNGFIVDQHTHEAMKILIKRINNNKKKYHEIAHIFLKNGTKPYAIGDILKQPDLAQTLTLIAQKGERAFYEGPIADAIINSVKESPITKNDLKNYSLKYREPLKGTFREYTIFTMPPPSSGGPCLLEILNIINQYPKNIPSDLFYARLTESMKNAFADRAQYLGDADFNGAITTDVKKMLSTSYAKLVHNTIENRKAKTIPTTTYGIGQFIDIKPDYGTTHLSIIDRDGSIVSLTDTINHHFGSLIVPKGTGIVLNNEIDDFAVKAYEPNEYGLIMSERNIITPGQRPLSSMTPTIITKDETSIAIGASGGPHIISGTLHSIINLLEFDKHPAEAVTMPRFHHQWRPDILNYEQEFPQKTIQALKNKGHIVKPYKDVAGVVQIAMKKNGILYGVSDPRKGGIPAGK
jgi:gamma-glutamyltranspeptidase / glutathione hydrolase